MGDYMDDMKYEDLTPSKETMEEYRKGRAVGYSVGYAEGRKHGYEEGVRDATEELRVETEMRIEDIRGRLLHD